MSYCLPRLGKTLPPTRPGQRQEGAREALLTLTAINLLNFADRYVPASVKELLKEDLKLSDTETALPTTGMVIVYMVSAVAFGVMNDRRMADRRAILAGGVAFWSLATALAGLSQNLEQLVLLRSLVGVGEAAYGTIAPPLISDFFPPAERNVAYGFFYLAIPVGGALGYGLGAVIGSLAGWRLAFIFCGAPGLVAAAACLRLNDPPRGGNDDTAAIRRLRSGGAATTMDEGDDFHDVSGVGEIELREASTRLRGRGGKGLVADADEDEDEDEDEDLDLDLDDGGGSVIVIDEGMDVGGAGGSEGGGIGIGGGCSGGGSLWRDLVLILSNRHWALATLGLAANNFALGGLADWYATFALRYEGASLAEAGLVVGAVTVFAGIGGTVLGSKAAQAGEERGWRSAFLLVPALFTVPGALLLVLSISVDHDAPRAFFFLFLAETCVWTNLAPISTVRPSIRRKKKRALIVGPLLIEPSRWIAVGLPLMQCIFLNRIE
jgi:hypothetical protein